MSGRDLIATAETGSGKTAAYLIPLIDKLHGKHASTHGHTRHQFFGPYQMAQRILRGIRAMVLVPTRELAAQVAKEFGILARNTRLKCALIVGGDSMTRQLPGSAQRSQRPGRMPRATQ